MTGSAADSRMNHPRVTGDAGAVNSLTIDRIASDGRLLRLRVRVIPRNIFERVLRYVRCCRYEVGRIECGARSAVRCVELHVAEVLAVSSLRRC